MITVSIMAEFTFSKMTLTHGVDNGYRTVVELSVDENADDSGDLLLTLEATETKPQGKKGKSICVEYFSEKQILEMYFFLKAALAAKHSAIL